MSLIPNNYVLEEGKDAPEGTELRTCKFCKRTFAVPTAEAAEKKYIDVCDQESCKELYDKEVGVLVSSLMKNPTDAADTIKKALGD